MFCGTFYLCFCLTRGNHDYVDMIVEKQLMHSWVGKSCSQTCCYYHWIYHKYDGRILCQFGTLVLLMKTQTPWCHIQLNNHLIIGVVFKPLLIVFALATSGLWPMFCWKHVKLLVFVYKQLSSGISFQIPARTMFGPYGGVNIQDAEKAHASGYCWQVGYLLTLNNIINSVCQWWWSHRNNVKKSEAFYCHDFSLWASKKLVFGRWVYLHYAELS